MYYELKAKDIQQNTDILVRLHGEFVDCFRTSTRSVAPQGLDYLKGQLLLESRRNMSRMSVEVVDEDEQSLSHFISNSPWEDEPLIEAIGKRAVELLSQDGVSGALILDESGIPFEFAGMDAHYGEQPWLLTQLEENDVVYVADVSCNIRVSLEYPEVGLPERDGNRGRLPTKLKVLQGKPVEVRQLLSSDKIIWRTLKVRDTQRGEPWIRFSALRVWRIEDEIPCDQPVWLLIRQELDGSDTKFSFSNAKDSTPIEILTEWQSRRYFVERPLQDAKGLAGLDEYQVTGWRG